MSLEITNIELDFFTLADYQELKQVMISSYYADPNAYWEEHQIKTLLEKFPEGQVVLKVNGEIAGGALSIIIDHEAFDGAHTYKEITGNFMFDTHDPEGDMLYGIDVFIKPDFRGLRLGRRLYEYRKQLAERFNLKGILFGGRIPNYHLYADVLNPKEYIEKVRSREIQDPVLNFQLSNDFHPVRVLNGYLDGDKKSMEFAVLLRWDNVYYQKPATKAKIKKRVVRLGLLQWQMRNYANLQELMQHAEFFIDTLSGYNSDFVLFPEFFNTPLMAKNNDLNEAESIRKLAEFTPEIVKEFSRLSIKYNVNIITGSMPEKVGLDLYNVGYVCKRDGAVERYEKIHVTPSEEKWLGMKGGNKLKVIDTDCGKIGVLICYDVEFPELSRLLAEEKMEILFVPFLTDSENGFSRVRFCAQARAIENECYVAIAGSVGNLPKVNNMDIQYAQSMVFTPCDFSFPTDGIRSKATPNSEMILISDVDLDLLRELHNYGTVKNLKNRRKDVYNVVRV